MSNTAGYSTRHSETYRDEDLEDSREPSISKEELRALRITADPIEELGKGEREILAHMARTMGEDLQAAMDDRWERGEQRAGDMERFAEAGMNLERMLEKYRAGGPGESRSLEKQDWEASIRFLQEVSEKYRDEPVNEALELVSNWQERRNTEQLMAMFPPEKTVIVGRQEIQEEVARDFPFTQDERYPHLTQVDTGEEIAGKHVIGNLQMHLEAMAESVTTYMPIMPYKVREARSQEKRWYTQEEMKEHTNEMVQYRVTQTDRDPRSFPEDWVIVVTQHMELVDALTQRGIIDKDTQVITHLDEAFSVEGMHLIGEASPEMKILAKSVTALSYDSETGEYGEARNFTVEPLARIPIKKDRDRPIWMIGQE